MSNVYQFPRIVTFPDIPEGACLGEFCPQQTNSIGETEGIATILADVQKCERVAGCVLNTTVDSEEIPHA